MDAVWREQHPQSWVRLWDRHRPEECPVCLQVPDLWDGPLNSDVPTRCSHWACVDCWARVAEYDGRCPVCREDVSGRLLRYLPEGDSRSNWGS